MKKTLLELTTETLLKKFGAGNHKPGSGSAAAFQGMLSAELLITVIALTEATSRKKKYVSSLPHLRQMRDEINSRILPDLSTLFEEDSIQFGKTISSRKERDKETDPIRKGELARQALEELKIAIDLPLRIANLCTALAEIADSTFDNGFQGARGDTQVALSGAVAAVGGCLSIVQLNLLQYKSDEYEWTKKIELELDQVREHYKRLNTIASSKIDLLKSEFDAISALNTEVNLLIAECKGKSRMDDEDIENWVRTLQLLTWKHRGVIWKKNTPQDPREILDPAVIFKSVLGYHFCTIEKLEVHMIEDTVYETAGEIDQKKKQVIVSNAYPQQTQRFTGAHELGHAMLHRQNILHRDIPIAGDQMPRKSKEEKQADAFAAKFLMPKKLIQNDFVERFLTQNFIINQNTAFNLGGKNPSELMKECRDLDGLCRKLAESETFAGRAFPSLAEVYKVSVGAMAIRLKELGLVEFHHE